jgi:uncharacterized protein (DUF3820 family)
MTDVDLMPYGKYKGEQMANVPPEYLLWLFENNKCSGNVKAYIEDAMDFLKGEIKLKKKNQQ